MRHVSLQQAKDQLGELASLVESGEQVVVTRDGEPVMRLVACEPRREGVNFSAIEDFKRLHGIDKIVTFVADDFDDPLPEDFLLRPLP